MSSERQSSRSRDWAGSGALLPLLKAFRGHLTSPRHSWLRCGFARGCLPSSPVLGHDRRRSGLLGSPSPHCLSSEALSISCHGREDSGQYWKGNPGEELWEKICQRVGPAASLQRSSTTRVCCPTHRATVWELLGC